MSYASHHSIIIDDNSIYIKDGKHISPSCDNSVLGGSQDPSVAKDSTVRGGRSYATAISRRDSKAETDCTANEVSWHGSSAVLLALQNSASAIRGSPTTTGGEGAYYPTMERPASAALTALMMTQESSSLECAPSSPKITHRGFQVSTQQLLHAGGSWHSGCGGDVEGSSLSAKTIVGSAPEGRSHLGSGLVLNGGANHILSNSTPSLSSENAIVSSPTPAPRKPVKQVSGHSEPSP